MGKGRLSAGAAGASAAPRLGHANPTVTLSAYAHLFERADHAQAAREALEASYEAMAGTARR